MGTKQYDSATDLLTFSRASSATFLGSNGLLQTAANNIPRIEYDATGAVKGLLIEEARTNIARYSEDFTQGYWRAYNAVTTTGNVAVSPDGTLTADRIAAKNTGPNNGAFTNDDVPTGGCVSVFAKADTVDWLGFGEAGVCWAYFDLANGVTGNKSTTVGYTSITAYPNGWYLCQAWGITTSWSRVLFSPKPTEGNGDPWSNVTNAIGDSVFLWGAQFEAGAFPTSYIPTTGATATRARDLAEIPTSAFGYNNDAGSLVIDVLTPVADQFMTLAIFNTISFFNSRGLWKSNSAINTASDYLVFDSYDGTTTRFVFGQQTQAVYAKIGLSYGDIERAVKDGGTVVSGTSRSPNPTRLHLGGRDNGYQSQCWIKSIQYYPRRLTDTQLQELTT